MFMGLLQYRRRLKISIILLAVVLILVSAYYAFRPGRAHFVSQTSYFTVVLDCGSTGTRVNVYEWLRNFTSNQDLPTLLHSFPDNSTKNPLWKDSCRYHCMQTEPGLNKFVHNSSGVREALEPLLFWAEWQIPSERLGDTALFLLATAGLRSLPNEDADWILENAEAVVKEHPFVYRTSSIRVLSGEEEAYYSWVALNYKLGSLENPLKAPTLGVLDLGGSSLQVVMEIDELKEHKHFISSKIGSSEHQILAYSLPKFGLNEAFNRTIIMLSEEQQPGKSADGRFKLRHPCLSSGFMQNYTCYGCFQSNATNLQNLSGQSLSYQSTLIYLLGDPDWEQCKVLARSAAIHSSSSDWLRLKKDMSCKARLPSSSGTGSLNSTAIYHLVDRFHALSGFFAVYNVLNLSPRANLTQLLERGQQLCSRSWTDLKRISGNQNNAEQFCFRVPYLASLIEDALCLGDAEIFFGPGDVSWTLGAALVEGEYLRLSQTEAQAGRFTLNKVEVNSSPALFFVLFLCILFIVYCGQFKRIKNLVLPTLGKKDAAVGLSLPSYIYPKWQTK